MKGARYKLRNIRKKEEKEFLEEIGMTKEKILSYFTKQVKVFKMEEWIEKWAIFMLGVMIGAIAHTIYIQ